MVVAVAVVQVDLQTLLVLVDLVVEVPVVL
jgi:hypothetical protein